MKGAHLLLMGFTLILITLLMAYDFFPSFNDLLHIPRSIFIGLLLVIILIGFINNRVQKDSSSKISLWWQVILPSYLLVLIVVFTLFGGASQVGISLSSPVVWILLIISFFDIVKELKKIKLSESSA
ncbi:hypothetical protein SLU01_10200 [Sporosarcina luteola]|uniref:Uncharacterized protein n=1 Tax=Sporosarcina luteola TaxID=582850 RepID=A0A511Z5I0_9BACL|nr:hypothetical protein [Sporosarcina luteola]GEN82708.1 hypothetical protein SLU01_10200 [Sporosarcina luteola]